MEINDTPAPRKKKQYSAETLEKRRAYNRAWAAKQKAEGNAPHTKQTPEEKKQRNDALQAWRRQNAEHYRQQSREYYQKHREEKLQRIRERREAEPEKFRERERDYYSRNPERQKGAVKKAIQANPEGRKATQRDYFIANRHIYAEHARRRYASELKATPKWLTAEHIEKMREIYRTAQTLTRETGVVHHVDHIVPLQGENVCGLHVPWNLQVLTATENISKHNKILEEYIFDQIHSLEHLPCSKTVH